MSTYQVVSVLGWVDTYWGLTGSADGVGDRHLLFRHCFQTIPNSLAEAAQLDGAGRLGFCEDSCLRPQLSKANIAALFVILFVYR